MVSHLRFGDLMGFLDRLNFLAPALSVQGNHTPTLSLCNHAGDQTGSFWYHSQLSVQYADSLHGTLIIYDPDDPLAHLYDIDDASTVLSVADWWHNTSTSGLASYLATQIIPVSDSGLFNARDTMTIIEADGVATEPHEPALMTIFFKVTANQAVGNYWINAFINAGNPAHNLNLNTHPGVRWTTSVYVLLHVSIFVYVRLRIDRPSVYKGSERSVSVYTQPWYPPLRGCTGRGASDPLTAGPTGADAVMLNAWELVPLDPIPAPEPDFNLTFRTFMPMGLTAWEINNISYIPPSVPTLVWVLQGEMQQMDFNETENMFLFPANKTIQVEIIEGIPSTCTAWMNFWVVKSNGSDIINTNPIRRDVDITGNDNIILRFRTDKPGQWFCGFIQSET
ncbi:hypothetical protein B0H13DRAFT_2304200 [Mycena leptocephala]|nr:hypothetical protein B0H13DRAFT_2304200 [Mycena leptocephala]